MSAAAEQKKIPALTSLRFLAAFHVVLYHTVGYSFPILLTIPLMRQFVAVDDIAVGFFSCSPATSSAMSTCRAQGPSTHYGFTSPVLPEFIPSIC